MVALLLMSASGVQSRSIERPVILLSCPETSTIPADPLCQAMIQALAEAGAGHIIRRVARGEETPRRPNDIGLALFVDETDPNHLTGHMDWQTGDGPRQVSPQLSFDAGDATNMPHSYEIFARGLIKADPKIAMALNPKTKP